MTSLRPGGLRALRRRIRGVGLLLSLVPLLGSSSGTESASAPSRASPPSLDSPPSPDSAPSPEYVVHLHEELGAIPSQGVTQVRRRLSDRRERIDALLGRGTGTAPVQVHLYPTVEAKGLASGDMSVAHADPDAREIHLSLQRGLSGEDVAVEALLAATDRWGPAATRALEIGLVVHLSDAWLGATPEFWVARLHRAGVVPSLPELLEDERFDQRSPILYPAVAAVLVGWLRDREGEGGLRARYRGWKPTPEDLRGLEPEWDRRLDEVAAASREPASHPWIPGVPRPTATQGFRRGFNLAHEGYQIHDGFGSRSASGALDRLRSLEANSVAVLPYAFLADPHSPGPFRYPLRPGQERDEAVIHAALEARDRGMSVLLKPHLWIRRSWPGEIRMENPGQWDLFFREYAEWISHYAVLAEAYGLDSLCLGVELSAATLEEPHRWRELAERVRRIYSGALGYCANWGEEAETLEFWDAMDFVGVSSYYPLSSRTRPTDAELLRSARRAMGTLETLGRRYGLPVYLTEAGFASAPAPWRRPWEEERGPGARVDLEAQARAYRILAQAVEEREGIRGIYWWKWPTAGPRTPLENTRFTPAGKPAEAVVARWFGRLAEAEARMVPGGAR